VGNPREKCNRLRRERVNEQKTTAKLIPN